MHPFYFLCVLAIFLSRGTTLEIDSNVAAFAKMCFLPKTPVVISLKDFTVDDKHPEIHYAVIGNDVMQHKVYEFLTENKEKASQEDLEKMCFHADFDSVGNGVASGKIFGFQTVNSNYTCQDSNDLPGVLRCNFQSASQQFDEAALSYLSIANGKYIFQIYCFKSGHVGWALHSKTPKISQEVKRLYYAHAASLGFPENTNVILHGDHCVD